MPWETIKLSNGSVIPRIGFGTWHAGNGQQSTDQVEQAVSVGFDHIDTAQSYRNEAEAGQALRESGVPRSQIFITTKYSGLKDDVKASIQDSLNNLGVSYVDLYLIHHPSLNKGDYRALWKKFEQIHAEGLAKSIGVSNFKPTELADLLKHCKVKPVVNQIEFHPYIQADQVPTVTFCHDHNIAIEAYSPLRPLTQYPGGPLEKPLAKIRKRTGATSEQILLAWNKTKGTIVLTASTKKWRLEDYIKAGDLELKKGEIHSLDVAGAKGPTPKWKNVTARLVMTAAAACILWSASRVLGVGF